MQQPEGLLSVLLDAGADIASRDDAAMQLHAFDSPDVEAALAIIACDLTADEIIRASCGESLAEIWLRRKAVNATVLTRLSGPARDEALSLLRYRGMTFDA